MFTHDWIELTRTGVPLQSTIELDAETINAIKPFDLDTNGTTSFVPWDVPNLPETWSIGVIVGGSGTGKTTLLQKFGTVQEHIWDNTKSVVSHFVDGPDKLYAVGLSSVPTWVKPFNVLSNGERFRAELARSLNDHAVIDEYTSVVDRNVAQAASKSLSKYIRARGVKNVVISTCHRDVLEWLQPDWIIDTDAGLWCREPQEYLQCPTLVADIYEVKRPMWNRFMEHHYLSTKLHPFARCWIAVVGGQAAAFGSSIPFPNGHIKRGWREHRTVTTPDFQGLGIGIQLSDWIAEAHIKAGYRYFSRTTHPRMGQYRESSPLWKATSSNLKKQKLNSNPNWVHWNFDDQRLAYSHEYVGIKQEGNIP